MSNMQSLMRCTPRKHVVENGRMFCDCKAVMIAPTAAKNALVVTKMTESDLPR